jgi:DNA-binding transcriptional ArsR family regulator
VGIINRKNTIIVGGDMIAKKEIIPPQCCTLNISGKSQERLVNMFKALGNPVRFEIIKFLVTHPGCITGDIVKHLPIAQATVSQHLKVLKAAGWITGSIEGTATCYQLDEKSTGWFRAVVKDIF